jgi:exodeoxyribonuclease V beta subunit
MTTTWRDYDLSDPMTEDMLCLEASAGTGKTYTIEGMVARLVAEEGVDIKRLLVVTFTNAATVELKTRIRKILRDAREALARGDALKDDHAVVPVLLTNLSEGGQRAEGLRRLSRAIEGFDEARIATIHGFCQQALSENTFESGAPFGAEMQSTVRPLFEEIAYDGWTRGRHDADRRLLTYLDVKGLTPKTLINITKEISRDPEMSRIPKRPVDREGVDPALDTFDAALATLKRRWALEADDIMVSLITATEDDHLDKRRFGAKPAQSKRAKLDKWLASPSPSPCKAEPLNDFSSATLDAARSAAFKKTGGVIRHGLTDEVDALALKATAATAALEAMATHFIHDFADFAERALVQRKDERRLVSFDDLLKTLQRGVSGPKANPALIEALQARFDIALIDEFQDTDPVQWDVFEAIFASPDHRMILVGDPKQAIYAFRGADIQTYVTARSHPAMTVAQMGINYRSDTQVVDGISHLFRHGDDPFLNTAIQYSDIQANHTAPRWTSPDGESAGVVFSFLRRSAVGAKAKGTLGAWGWPAPQQIVAAQIATFLQSSATVQSEDDTSTMRAVRPSDIAVLVRSNLNAQEVQAALRALGVPSTLRHNSTVFQSEEARELILVLEAVLTPRRAGQVRRALLTRLLGQDVSTLAALESNEAQWTLWMEQLGTWRRSWFETGFATFARSLTTTALPAPESDTPISIPARLLGWRDGERRVTNLSHLIELLHEASLKDDLAPGALLEWLKHERATEDSNEPLEQRQLRLESDGDAVTIVTVHKAKGLEYPFVWCPYLWSGTAVSKGKTVPLRFRDPNQGDAWTLDIGVDVGNSDKQAHVAIASRTNLSESTRQLYVALTRAKHQVHILCGAMKTLPASGLGHLLYPGIPKSASQPDEVLYADLKRLEETSQGTIAVRDLVTLPSAHTLNRSALGPDTPQAKVFSRDRPIDKWWRRTSFSGLAKNTRADEVPVQDHDTELEEDDLVASGEERSASPLPEPGHDDTRDLVLKGFRGGTQAGTCIHEIYEDHDFQTPDALRDLVAEKLIAYRFDAEAWTDAVTHNIQASLETPLGITPRLTLADLTLARRFDELDFVFPLRPDRGSVISAKQIGQLMTAHPGPGLPPGYGERLQALNFMPVRGFMVGSIDLIFEHQGRWYVVDYKSNNLGEHPADYTPRHLAEAMSHSHYTLQYHIYCVALHRYLRYRLGASYRFEEHFGGVRYLFMRGMSPDYAEGTGVFTDSPPKALVEGLSALLGGDA